MALSMVVPFTYGQYTKQTSGFAQWMAEYVRSHRIHGRIGWLEHFHSYQWKEQEKSWCDGVATRCMLHQQVRCANGGTQLLNAANRIVEGFGGIRPGYKASDACKIQTALDVLANEQSNPTFFEKRVSALVGFTSPSSRVSSHSKIFEAFDPSKWTIYDSRVATSLVCIVSRYWRGGGKVGHQFLRFPVPPRRDGQRPPNGFPNGSPGQDCVAFVYASWLLRRLAEILNADPKYGVPPTTACLHCSPLNTAWAVYNVEMALFMMGDQQF